MSGKHHTKRVWNRNKNKKSWYSRSKREWTDKLKILNEKEKPKGNALTNREKKNEAYQKIREISGGRIEVIREIRNKWENIEIGRKIINTCETNRWVQRFKN